MPSVLEPVTLHGRHTRLEPLGPTHAPGMVRAVDVDRASFQLTFVPLPTTQSVMAYIDGAETARLAGTALAFATLRVQGDGDAGEVVGSTRFMNVEWWPAPPDRDAHPAHQRTTPCALEIGTTWITPSAQRTAVNTEAKLAMLTYAFETLNVFRVALRTDERNAQSRANIERIGARLEGILRSAAWAADHSGPRNTATYALIAEDWPEAKERLTARLRP
jgi:N-acetyltransferase